MRSASGSQGKITDLKFKGRGQRLTPLTDVHGIIEFVMLLPGKHAANVRRQAAELLVRYLGGDLAITFTARMQAYTCQMRNLAGGMMGGHRGLRTTSANMKFRP